MPREIALGFSSSIAWGALCRWVVEHPRIAKRYAAFDAYLPGWYNRAVAVSAGATN
jgi:hypothetical protein